MKDIITVTSFTIKDMIKRKSFIISTLIILILIVIGFNIPNVIKLFQNEDYKEKILIVDKDNIFEDNLSLLNENNPDYTLIFEQKDMDDIAKDLENNEYEEAIILEKEDSTINIRYVVESISYLSTIREDIIENIKGLYSNIQINKLNLTPDELQSIFPNFSLNIEQTNPEEVGGNIIVMLVICIVLFYAIYFCAYQVSSSITIEKTSKIIETLVTSTTPKTIVLGKTLGIGIVGLFQVILIIITSVICAKLCLTKELLATIFDLSNLTISLGIVTLIYFVLGYFVFALLYALTGSTVSKPEDVQSANGPVAIVAVLGFYLSYITMMDPTSKLNVIASFLPISSPFCMPIRLMMGLSSLGDVIISIGILLLTIFIIAKVTIKIYSNAILNYGSKLSIKDIISIYKEK